MRPRRSATLRRAFTVIEVLSVTAVVGLVVAIAIPKVGNTLRRARLDRAATVVAADLQSAFSLAARQRRPVRLVRSTVTGEVGYRINQRATGAVVRKRDLGTSTEFGLTSIVLSRDPVDFFPTGVASEALTVTLRSGTSQRQVQMTTAGYVRVVDVP